MMGSIANHQRTCQERRTGASQVVTDLREMLGQPAERVASNAELVLGALREARDALVDAMVRLDPRPSKVGEERRRLYTEAHRKVNEAIARLERS